MDDKIKMKHKYYKSGTRCCICNELIYDVTSEDIECAVTKRKTVSYFHYKCLVDAHKIL